MACLFFFLVRPWDLGTEILLLASQQAKCHEKVGCIKIRRAKNGFAERAAKYLKFQRENKGMERRWAWTEIQNHHSFSSIQHMQIFSVLYSSRFHRFRFLTYECWCQAARLLPLLHHSAQPYIFKYNLFPWSTMRGRCHCHMQAFAAPPLPPPPPTPPRPATKWGSVIEFYEQLQHLLNIAILAQRI